MASKMVPLVLRPARDAAKESVGTDGTNSITDTASSAINSFLGSFGAVAARQVFGQNDAAQARQPAPSAPSFMDWVKQNTVLVAVGAVVLLGGLFLVLRRR